MPGGGDHGQGWQNPNHPMHRPAGGGSPAPAQPGNLMALKHGALAARVVEPVARELVEMAVAEAPYLQDASYRPAVESWATAEAKARLLDAYLQRVGVLDADGQPRPALDALRMWEKRASEERARLGLDPLSRAKLSRDVTASQASLTAIWDRLQAEGEST